MTTTPTPEALALAERALDEIAPRGAVGEVVDALPTSDAVLSLRYRSLLDGYPDWLWTVAVSTSVEGAPTVLEVALLPGDGSLVAPEWVPWADRLADYLASKEQESAEADAGDETEDGDEADDGDETEDGDEVDGFDDFDEDDLVAAAEDVLDEDAIDDPDDLGDVDDADDDEGDDHADDAPEDDGQRA